MRLKRLLCGLGIVPAAILFILGLGTLLPRPAWTAGGPASAAAAHAGGRMILILSSDIHSDIALPADPDVLSRFGFMAEAGLDPAQPGVAWIVAGWGSRSFYIATPTWSDLKPGPLARALTLDRSVMHMELAGDIDPVHPSVQPVLLSGAGFETLIAGIEASFARDGAGRPVPIAGASYGEFDAFYEGIGHFNALAGCNVWTSRMLRMAGVSTGWWTPLPQLLEFSLRLHNGDDVVLQLPGERWP
ncbi:uncharacterized protein (TIGR02117 family) [Hoeflea marina]|uniref:Uncharacterized protein (TIGR02117 family) n=1 Tax=Hoeflea marina TaxID=274592 RepID=A0A317PR92_9HYPH|nr:TIGR02117 family protein [Hoeflea marina]PWW04001.1 uncharacterized protein (TIGR02117 family) [Hoeflea marina]